MTYDASIYIPFSKVDKQDDGTVIVSGKVTDATPDLDGQRTDLGWFKGAVQDWFDTAANVREMHQLSAVGKGVALEFDGDGAPWVTSKIVDPVAAKKCSEGVYTGYSYGLKRHQVVRDPEGLAPNGLIKGGTMIELSVVDRGAHPNALISLDKVAEADLEKREFSDEKRSDLADEGKALPDGSFPIETKGDLKNAIQAFGRAKDKAAAKAHIIKRAKALDATDELPDSWKALAADLVKGEPDTAAIAQAVMVQIFEMQDAELFGFAAEVVRYCLLRMLHEGGDDIDGYALGWLSNVYSQLVEMGRQEADDAYEAQLAQILPRLGTQHDMTEMTETSSALQKVGKEFSKKNTGALQTVHDAIKALIPDVCKGGDMDKAAVTEIVREVLASEEMADLVKAANPDKSEDLADLTKRLGEVEANVEAIGAQMAPSRAYQGPAQQADLVKAQQADPFRARMEAFARSHDPRLRDEAAGWLAAHPKES